MATAKKLTVACIQYASPHISPKDNLCIVEPLIERAKEKGAQFILLPELALHKYSWDGLIIWDSAESLKDGKHPTITQLMKLAKRLNIYIGFSFLEVEHTHFYNTFILLNNNGDIEGNTKIRKNSPASNEAFVFKGSNDEHFINTKEFGQIGVAICFENHLSRFENEIRYKLNRGEEIALILQPHCAMLINPVPMINETACKYLNQQMDKISVEYAKAFGIATVMANKSGNMESVIPSGIPTSYYKSQFAGWSKIVNNKSEIICEAKYNEKESEIIIGEIELGQNNEYIQRKYNMIQGEWTSFNEWPSIMKLGFTMSSTLGWIGYTFSPNRRLIASKITKDYTWISSLFVHVFYGVVIGNVLYKKLFIS